MMDNVEEESLPGYVSYLLSPDTPLDFHITCGDPATDNTERIGIVKLMLVARSPVMKKMMLESPLKHDSEMTITDIEPDTFKDFLKFVYGFDLVPSLSVEDALKLLYVAEKYEVVDLKRRLRSVLKPKVSMENVFMFLEYDAVCEKVPELWAAIVKIIQLETKEVFSHQQFIEASLAAVLHIIQQNCINVREVDVWKAALAWATHQLTAADCVPTPESLRERMLPLLKHIRLCTMTAEELTAEVLQTKILTYDEICQVYASVSQKKPCMNSDILDSEIRNRFIDYSKIKQLSMIYDRESNENEKRVSELSFIIKKLSIKLETFIIAGIPCPWLCSSCGLTYEIKGIIKIYKMIDYINKILAEPRVILIAEQTEFGKDLEISLKNQLVSLDRNSVYKITFDLANTAACYENLNPKSAKTNQDLDISVDSWYTLNDYNRRYFGHLKVLKYQTVDHQ